MKLDASVMRTMNRQDFRVLAAVETGMKSRELVPVKIICALANLRHGGVHKVISSLLRDKLLSHDPSCGYDGYRLTNAGYDILALHGLKIKKVVGALGQRIGTGKESDVYLAASPEGKQIVLKFHRLGRTSFRDVKSKRDYFNYNGATKDYKRGGGVPKEQPQSWLFLSRISALKEFSFMKALWGEKYPTPEPLAHDRHVVAMSLVRGVPLYQINTHRVSTAQAQSIFEQSAAVASQLAQHGLVHCDLNEYNLVVDLSGVQAKNFANEEAGGDPYVRHSGLSVEIKGSLSAHHALQNAAYDATGELITEAVEEPTEFLSSHDNTDDNDDNDNDNEDTDANGNTNADANANGDTNADNTDNTNTNTVVSDVYTREPREPKPIVTLIDFPQMVSTKHPNAKELYDRDFACLKKFFQSKLKLNPPDDKSWDDWIPSFEQVTTMPIMDPLTIDEEEGDDHATHCTSKTNKTTTTLLASKAQLRIDQELQASGYSAEDSQRQMQLYYHTQRQQEQEQELKEEDDEDSDSEEEEEDESANNGNHEKDNASLSSGEEDEVVEDLKQPTVVQVEFDNLNVNGRGNNAGQQDGDDTSQSVVTFRTNRSSYTALTYAEAETRARERVRKSMDDVKQKTKQQGAYRNKNSNKSFHKGKRIYKERYD
jgi:RIO kinase 2